MTDKLHLLLDRLENVKPLRNNAYAARCPSHDDRRNSLSVRIGQDGRILVKCHANCQTKTILAQIGLTWADLFPNGNGQQYPKRRIETTYDYQDANGNLLYQVVRYQPKDFRQRQPNGKGDWIWSVNNPPVRRVLYRLPELLAANSDQWVFIPEGEKDVDRLWSLKLVATTNVGGAGKWLDEYNANLKGRRAALLPDNDDLGREHALNIAKSLDGIALDIRIIELPDLSVKGDVSDWLNNGGNRARLLELVNQTPSWRPPHLSLFSTP